jgi:hypothetical protein
MNRKGDEAMTRKGDDMPPDHASDLARAEAALEAAATALRLARRNRQTAQGEINRIHAAQAADAQAADAERWADPRLAARLAEAREVLVAAEAQRDAVHATLTAEYRAQERRDAVTFRANYGRAAELTTPGAPSASGSASRVLEDPRYIAAERTRGDVRALVQRLAKVAHRSALARKYAATTRQAARSSPVTAALVRLGVRSEAPGADRVEIFSIES